MITIIIIFFLIRLFLFSFLENSKFKYIMIMCDEKGKNAFRKAENLSSYFFAEKWKKMSCNDSERKKEIKNQKREKKRIHQM